MWYVCTHWRYNDLNPSLKTKTVDIHQPWSYNKYHLKLSLYNQFQLEFKELQFNSKNSEVLYVKSKDTVGDCIFWQITKCCLGWKTFWDIQVRVRIQTET